MAGEAAKAVAPHEAKRIRSRRFRRGMTRILRNAG
jgi:hypothetical protein